MIHQTNVRQIPTMFPEQNPEQRSGRSKRGRRGKKTKKERKDRERERKKTVSSSTTTRRKKCTWTMVRRREQEEEGREKRVSVNRERTLPRYRGLDSKFKSYYPVDAIRRGLELGWRGWGRRRGGWCKYMTQRHCTSLKIEISK